MSEIIDRPVTPYAERLHKKIELCDVQMKPYLEHSQALIEKYTGPYYWQNAYKDDPGKGKRLVLPGFFAYINSVLPYLATQNPAVNITAKISKLRHFAKTYEGASNHLLDEINFVSALQRMVLDSLFGFGVCKTGICDYEDKTSPEGFLHDSGQFYADRVDPKKFVWDTNAAEWEKAFFIGNRFSWPVDFCRTLAAEGKLDSGGVKKLIDEQDRKFSQNATGAGGQEEQNSDRLDPQIRLIEIWEPRSNRIKIISDVDCDAMVLSDEEYTGPERGPYVMLGYHFVPGRILPLAPLSVLKELDELTNEQGQKLYNRIMAEKSVLLVEEGVKDDTVEGIRMAKDGGIQRVEAGVISGKKTEMVNFTGITPGQTQLSDYLQNQMNIHGANFKTLGGTQASSRTATQDQQLLQQASHTVTAMQDKVREFTKEIVRKLAWYLWQQSGDAIPLTQMIAGEMEDVPFDPDRKEGDFLDYSFDIEPYSAATKDPKQLYADTMTLMRDVIIPTLPVAMQQGDAPAMRELIRVMADHLDINVDTFFRNFMPPNQASQPAGTATQTAGVGQPRPQGQPQPSRPVEGVA